MYEISPTSFFRSVVLPLVLYAKDNPQKIEGNIRYVGSTQFVFTDKSIIINDHKKRLKLEIVIEGNDYAVLYKPNDERKLKRLLSSKRWETAISNIASMLEEDVDEEKPE